MQAYNKDRKGTKFKGTANYGSYPGSIKGFRKNGIKMNPQAISTVISMECTWTRHMLSSRGVVMVICFMHYLNTGTLMSCIIGICLQQRGTLIEVINHCINVYLQYKVFFVPTSTKYQWSICIFQKVS